MKAALHLWLWLDRQCSAWGKAVRSVGGLLVVGTSVQVRTGGFKFMLQSCKNQPATSGRRVAAALWPCPSFAASANSALGLGLHTQQLLRPWLQESRRVELQLRGRAGRQGDPGMTVMMYDMYDPWVVVQNATGAHSTACHAMNRQLGLSC